MTPEPRLPLLHELRGAPKSRLRISQKASHTCQGPWEYPHLFLAGPSGPKASGSSWGPRAQHPSPHGPLKPDHTGKPGTGQLTDPVVGVLRGDPGLGSVPEGRGAARWAGIQQPQPFGAGRPHVGAGGHGQGAQPQRACAGLRHRRAPLQLLRAQKRALTPGAPPSPGLGTAAPPFSTSVGPRGLYPSALKLPPSASGSSGSMGRCACAPEVMPLLTCTE